MYYNGFPAMAVLPFAVFSQLSLGLSRYGCPFMAFRYLAQHSLVVLPVLARLKSGRKEQ
jgi:hypothetical protein